MPTDLSTLATDMASAIALASRSLPHVDRLDQRVLIGCRNRLSRYHSALTAQMKHPLEGPYGTNGTWGPSGREPGIRDIIRTVERISASVERRAAA